MISQQPVPHMWFTQYTGVKHPLLVSVAGTLSHSVFLGFWIVLFFSTTLCLVVISLPPDSGRAWRRNRAGRLTDLKCSFRASSLCLPLRLSQSLSAAGFAPAEPALIGKAIWRVTNQRQAACPHTAPRLRHPATSFKGLICFGCIFPGKCEQTRPGLAVNIPQVPPMLHQVLRCVISGLRSQHRVSPRHQLGPRPRALWQSLLPHAANLSKPSAAVCGQSRALV